MKAVVKLAEENRRMDLVLTQQLEHMQRDATAEIRKLRQQINSCLDAYKGPVDKAHPLEDRVLPFDKLAIALEGMHLESLEVVERQQIFQSLYFPRFTVRHAKIPDAHARTFGWAFRDYLTETGQRLYFADWLKSKAGVFWIRGKAGSGKSTLMKFVADHPTTTAYLKQWAGGNRLAICRYYFWNAGSDLQKSQEGLLRTLLFQLFKAAPQVIDSYAREEFRGLLAPNNHLVWNVKDLITTLKTVLHRCSEVRVCFFIDGLDEYKGESDTLIELMQDLCQPENVKLCVSSRPWVEFIDAFGQADQRLLKLEDLTRSDIANYTSDRLTSNPKFCKLADWDDRYKKLVEEVVNKAQGVFLWVYLVVKSLLEGVRYADTLEDLKARLDAFPRDLEDFFRHMLDDIPKIYLRKTSQMFRMATTAGAPMPLMIYSFTDDIDADPTFALKAKRRSMPHPEIDKRNEELPLRLDGRSKGLLEVTAVSDASHFFKYEVDFLHRTVRDFLETSSEVKDMFSHSLTEQYNPDQVLCHAHLAMLKLAPRFQEEMNDDRWMCTVEGLFQFAHQVQLVKGNSECVHEALEQARALFDSPGSARLLWERDTNNEFMAMAIQAGLVDYVDRNIDSLQRRLTRPWLYYGLQLPWRKKTFPGTWPYSPEMIRCLIRHGGDPNERNEFFTLWTAFLSRVSDEDNLRTNAVFEIIQTLILDGGARLQEAMPASDEQMTSKRTRDRDSGDLDWNATGTVGKLRAGTAAPWVDDTFDDPMDFREQPREDTTPMSPKSLAIVAQKATEGKQKRELARDVLRRTVPKSVFDFILANCKQRHEGDEATCT